jgi:hypothetical protein
MDAEEDPSGAADDDDMQLSIDDSALCSPSFMDSLFASVTPLPLPRDDDDDDDDDDENVDLSFAFSMSHENDVIAVTIDKPGGDKKCDTAAGARYADYDDRISKPRSHNQRADEVLELWAIYCEDSNSELKRREELGKHYNLTASQMKQKFGNFSKRGMPACAQKLMGVRDSRDGHDMYRLWLAALDGKSPKQVVCCPKDLEMATQFMKQVRAYMDSHHFPTKGYACDTASVAMGGKAAQ